MAFWVTGADGQKRKIAGIGAPGKTAYESAQDGGYTGTEEQFNASLASGGAPNVQFVTLPGTGWSSSQNVVSVPGMTATSKVIVGLAEPNTSEQYDAAVKAQLHCITKADGSITIAANGTTPSIDIPIVVYFWGGTA